MRDRPLSGVLERYGYRVLEAVSGVAALTVWQQHRDQIQLLLTDMVMPQGISGRELAAKLLAEKPALKVVYSSGYSLAVVGADMVLQEGLNFLQKPYHPRKLAQTIRDCLDR
jgi:two-component system, cell cycle sensor histidine kinase and response regulator CckA